MQIQGEAFFLMNGWMDYLCLLLAARLGRRRLSPCRGLLGALFGAAYSLAAIAAGPAAQGLPALLLAGQLMAWIAFGRGLPWGGCAVFGAGMLLHGGMDFLLARGFSAPKGLLFVSLLGLALWALLGRLHPRGRGPWQLLISWRGREARLPALRDSGNLLRDGVTGLPVILLSERSASPLLAKRFHPDDPASLPAGGRLILLETAAGKRMVPCFHPDKIILIHGARRWQTDALIAVSDFGEHRALLPDALFLEQKEEYHASL